MSFTWAAEGCEDLDPGEYTRSGSWGHGSWRIYHTWILLDLDLDHEECLISGSCWIWILGNTLDLDPGEICPVAEIAITMPLGGVPQHTLSASPPSFLGPLPTQLLEGHTVQVDCLPPPCRHCRLRGHRTRTTTHLLRRPVASWWAGTWLGAS